jgi:Fic family protein
MTKLMFRKGLLRLDPGWLCALHAAIGTLIHRFLRVEYLAFARSQPYVHRMESRGKAYIWQRASWPAWQYDLAALAEPLAHVHRAQGRLFGRMAEVGLGLRDQATLQVMTDDVLKTSEIEGEKLDPDAVRSSIARRLGVDIGAIAPVDRFVDGIVEMILDTTAHYAAPLTAERLFGWHRALFPTSYSGLSPINVGTWRTDANGPMQVVSGPIGRQRVHLEAPPASQLDAETARFLDWFNGSSGGDPVVKAGLAHLWLVTLHPFDDGNGRIARAVGYSAIREKSSRPPWGSIASSKTSLSG